MLNLLFHSRSAKWVAILALTLTMGWAADAAQSLTIAWNPSAASGIVGYRIRYGKAGTHSYRVVDAGTNTSFVVNDLQEGETNHFVVTAYDVQGLESPPSNLISYIVPGLVDLAPKASSRHPTVIRFVVAPGHTYQVQASGNLTTWDTIGQITAASNTWAQFEDIEGANLNLRFYRLVSQ